MDAWALGIAIAAFVISVAAAWYTRVQGVAQRNIDKREKRAEERDRIKWALEPTGRDEFALRNVGTETAYGVRVDPGDVIVRPLDGNNDLAWDEFPDGHGEALLMFQEWHVAATHIAVIWHHRPDLSDPEQTRRLLVSWPDR